MNRTQRKYFVRAMSALMAVLSIYGISYADHFCKAWHCGADTMMLVILFILSMTGILYSFLEMD